MYICIYSYVIWIICIYIYIYMIYVLFHDVIFSRYIIVYPWAVISCWIKTEFHGRPFWAWLPWAWALPGVVATNPWNGIMTFL